MTGKTGTGVRSREMGIAEGTGKEIGGHRNANATINVWSCYEAGQYKKRKNKKDKEGGGNSKESPGMGI